MKQIRKSVIIMASVVLGACTAANKPDAGSDRNMTGKTYSGGGNGGGLAIELTIRFKADSICECISDFYQAFPEPVKVTGTYYVRDGVVEVVCRPEGFEDTPIDWRFLIKDNGNRLAFNRSDTKETGSTGNDWLVLSRK